LGRGKGCCLIFWGKGKVAPPLDYYYYSWRGGKGKVAPRIIILPFPPSSKLPPLPLWQLGGVRGVACPNMQQHPYPFGEGRRGRQHPYPFGEGRRVRGLDSW